MDGALWTSYPFRDAMRSKRENMEHYYVGAQEMLGPFLLPHSTHEETEV
jgi:hypothetical protein